MISISRWFDRSFHFNLEEAYFPLVVERLYGATVRLNHLLANIPPETLRAHVVDQWSIQEHAGHLVDLEPLWLGRVDDILSGTLEMRPADLTNQATDSAHHDDKSIREITAAFEENRDRLTSRLASLSLDDASKSALHPRLKQPMRIIDLAIFVAEHDDHHLATIRNRLAAGEAE